MYGLRTFVSVAIVASVLVATQPVNAAGASDQGLPAICQNPASGTDGNPNQPISTSAVTTTSSSDMAGMDMPPAGAMDQAHQDLMSGMDAMDSQMAEGMLAPDLEVAFICGMIPHHQGAIDMAKVELKYGTDPFARSLAQDIIASQEAQIAQMRAWLEKRSKP